MTIENFNIHSYPASEKIYVKGELFPFLCVPMRKISLTPTVTVKNGEKTVRENAPVVVYDTSGVYTDPSVKLDMNQGLPRFREAWISERSDLEQLPGITSQYGRERETIQHLSLFASSIAMRLVVPRTVNP